jgi:hypothetical protein
MRTARYPKCSQKLIEPSENRQAPCEVWVLGPKLHPAFIVTCPIDVSPVALVMFMAPSPVICSVGYAHDGFALTNANSRS